MIHALQLLALAAVPVAAACAADRAAAGRQLRHLTRTRRRT